MTSLRCCALPTDRSRARRQRLYQAVALRLLLLCAMHIRAGQSVILIGSPSVRFIASLQLQPFVSIGAPHQNFWMGHISPSATSPSIHITFFPAPPSLEVSHLHLQSGDHSVGCWKKRSKLFKVCHPELAYLARLIVRSSH